MFLKVADVAERLKISASKVYLLVEQKVIGCFRIGGSIRFSEDHVNKYLESVEHQPQAEFPKKTNPKSKLNLKHINLD